MNSLAGKISKSTEHRVIQERESVQKFYVHSELRLCPLWSLKYEFGAKAISFGFA